MHKMEKRLFSSLWKKRRNLWQKKSVCIWIWPFTKTFQQCIVNNMEFKQQKWNWNMDEITDKIAFHYDELVREDNDPFRDPPEMKEYMEEWDGWEFFSLLALTGREKVLEIGCGTGRMAGAVLGSCREYTGLDLSPVSIVRARENLSSVPGTPHRTLLCGKFPDCFVPGKYDCIFSTLTFLHIEEKAAAMEKLASLLLPEGRIVLSLDKTRKEDIEYPGRTVPVFPDTPVSIKKACANTMLRIVQRIEKEKASLLLLTF